MKIKLLLNITVLLLLNIAKNADAQYVQDINGRPISVNNYTEIEGSPFIINEWKKGIVKFADNRIAKDLPLKYNELNDELLFQDTKEQTLIFIDEVKEFRLAYLTDNKPIEKLFRNGFKDIPNTTEKIFF